MQLASRVIAGLSDTHTARELPVCNRMHFFLVSWSPRRMRDYGSRHRAPVRGHGKVSCIDSSYSSADGRNRDRQPMPRPAGDFQSPGETNVYAPMEMRTVTCRSSIRWTSGETPPQPAQQCETTNKTLIAVAVTHSALNLDLSRAHGPSLTLLVLNSKERT